jgi:formamidopyrimidine-DNA glycosylase
MPELPEVQTIVDDLSPALRGALIRRVIVLRRDVIRRGAGALSTGLAGRRIAEIVRDGKRIHLRLEPAGRLVIHLGMSGRLGLFPPRTGLEPHTHLRVLFRDRPQELRFRDPRRFGGIWFIGDASGMEQAALPALGPDALSIRVPVLRQVLRRRRQIKALLLDQYAISGLGNIYCDESLHRAGIHPLARAATLTEPQVRALACSIRRTLRSAIDSGGSTLVDYRRADGSAGAFQAFHRVYGREGQPCFRCGEVIRRIQAAGRSTHLCPRCQRGGR